MSVTDLEIDEAIREAWAILYAEPAAPSSGCRLAAALLAVTGGTPAQPHWVSPDDLWRDRLAVLAEQLPAGGPGVGGRGGRPAGCPLPCYRKARRGARTPISCGVQPCGPAPMMTAGAGPRTSHDRGAGMTSNNPALPARGRGGANHPHLGSNPMVARSEWP